MHSEENICAFSYNLKKDLHLGFCFSLRYVRFHSRNMQILIVSDRQLWQHVFQISMETFTTRLNQKKTLKSLIVNTSNISINVKSEMWPDAKLH